MGDREGNWYSENLDRGTYYLDLKETSNTHVLKEVRGLREKVWTPGLSHLSCPSSTHRNLEHQIAPKLYCVFSVAHA